MNTVLFFNLIYSIHRINIPKIEKEYCTKPGILIAQIVVQIDKAFKNE